MQPGYQSTPQPTILEPKRKKSSLGKIIGGCLGLAVLSCCCFSGVGAYVGYLEERNMNTPTDDLASVPFQMGTPAQVTLTHTSSGYAFQQIWADLTIQLASSQDATLRGEVRCANGFGGEGYPDDVGITVWEQNRRVANVERSGNTITAKVMIHDEYMHDGEPPKACTVTLRLEDGVMTSGTLVTRTYQRPSDRFAN